MFTLLIPRFLFIQSGLNLHKNTEKYILIVNIFKLCWSTIVLNFLMKLFCNTEVSLMLLNQQVSLSPSNLSPIHL